MSLPARSFEQLLAEAERQPFSGWDFSYLQGRMEEERTSWNYAELVQARLAGIAAVLDMGTGGGGSACRPDVTRFGCVTACGTVQ